MNFQIFRGISPAPHVGDKCSIPGHVRFLPADQFLMKHQILLLFFSFSVIVFLIRYFISLDHLLDSHSSRWTDPVYLANSRQYSALFGCHFSKSMCKLSLIWPYLISSVRLLHGERQLICFGRHARSKSGLFSILSPFIIAWRCLSSWVLSWARLIFHHSFSDMILY